MIVARIATIDDQVRLIEFIRDHWAATHIFTQRPEVFEWQHLQADGRLNMVLAEDSESDRVLGVLGFIPMGRFDSALGDRDLLLAIWKVRDEGVPPGVGLRLLKLLQSELKPRMIAAIGTSKMVRPIYRALRYETGELRHAALFHPGRHGRLRIAAGAPVAAHDELTSVGVELLRLDGDASADVVESVERFASRGVPAKSWRYVRERYLDHPWYRYDVRAVISAGQVVGVVVWRRVEAEEAVALRIVDLIGAPDWLAAAGPALQREVVAADAEYIDLMSFGIENDLVASAGFVSPDDHPAMIIPNYFSPFERRNIEIELAYKVFDGDAENVRLFRADSDQDRPNLASDLSPSR